MRKKWIGFIFIINFIVDVFVTKNIDSAILSLGIINLCFDE